jgi:hypothetical protein
VYRAGQFFRALAAQVRPDEQATLDAFLTPAQQALFRRMPRHDQRHSLDVLYTLRRRGQTDPALMQAALLHDVAKSSGIHLWQRVAVVLLKAMAPRILDWLAAAPAGWRRGFYFHRQHPQRGAEWAAAADCDPLAVALIRHHQSPVPVEWQYSREGVLLAALQAADGEN